MYLFFFNCSSDVISLAGNFISWQSTGSVNSTLTAHHLVTDFTHSPRASRVAHESRSTLLVSCPKTVTLHRAVSYVTPHLMTPSTGTPSSLILNPSFSEHNPCGDQLPQLSGALAELGLFTGYEPKQLAENQDYRHVTEDKQLIEHEDFRVKPLFFHQSITASTCGSAESIATSPPLPLESDSDNEQLRALLASPLYVQEREGSAERSQVSHSERENLISSSSQDPISTGKLVTLFSSQNRLNQETFTEREDFLFIHQQVFWANLSSDSPTPQMLQDLFLMGTEITCLLKRDLNSRSRNTKWNILTLA